MPSNPDAPSSPGGAAGDGVPHPQARGRNNGFDLLRFVAASAVIFGHAHPLTGHRTPEWLGSHIGTIAVMIFFVTSGFLVARSWLAEPRLMPFIVKRFLRIMPGLILVVVFSALVVGPLATSLSLGDYFASSAMLTYLKNILLFPVFMLPGVFVDNTYPVAVNGSLWSLPAEVVMYVLTPLLLGYQARKAAVLVWLATIAGVFLSLYLVRMHPPATPTMIWGTGVTTVLEPAPFFLIGMIFAVHRLDTMARPLASLVMVLMAARWLSHPVVGEAVLLVLLPYAVISFGALRLAFLDPIFKRGDVSYGIYLYGFVVQQMVVHVLGNGRSPMFNFIVSFPIAVALAMASWVLVERPALAMKGRVQRFAGASWARLASFRANREGRP